PSVVVSSITSAPSGARQGARTPRLLGRRDRPSIGAQNQRSPALAELSNASPALALREGYAGSITKRKPEMRQVARTERSARSRSAQITAAEATSPARAKPMARGRIVPLKSRSRTAPRSAPPAVDTVPITAAAVPATGFIGSMAIVLKLGIRSA